MEKNTITINKNTTAAFSAILNYIRDLAIDEELKMILCSDVQSERNTFYYAYASQFTNINSELITKLNISGYFYFRYLILTDAVFDNLSKQDDILKQLICINWYHEESIKMLSSIFHSDPEFWKFWQKRKSEYIFAFKTDKKFILNLDEPAFEQLADHKSANGKTAIDILYLLKIINEKDYHTLLASHKLFSCALQCYDDIFDIKQDYENKQTNFALATILKAVPENSNIVTLQKLLHIKGHATALLMKSLNYLKESLELVNGLDCTLWKNTISTKMYEIQQVSKQVDFYVNSLKIRARLSGIKLYPAQNQFSLYTSQTAIHSGLQFIASEQEANGEWKDSPVNTWMSGYWTTGYVLYMLSKFQHADLNAINIHSASSFLTQKKSKIWGYIEGWIDDADSTNFALLGLLNKGIDLSEEITELLYYQQEDGGFTTYNNPEILLMHLNDPEKSDISGWTKSHLCVSAGTLLLLSKIKGYQNEKEQLINYILSFYKRSELFPSYWWTSGIYSTSILLEANRNINHPELNTIMTRTKHLLLKTIGENGFCSDEFNDRHIFYTALVLNAGSNYKKWTRDEYLILEKVAAALISMQNTDGSWDSSYALRIPGSDCHKPDSITSWKKSDMGENVIIEDIHRIITSSTVVCALNKFNQLHPNK